MSREGARAQGPEEWIRCGSMVIPRYCRSSSFLQVPPATSAVSSRYAPFSHAHRSPPAGKMTGISCPREEPHPSNQEKSSVGASGPVFVLAPEGEIE